MTVPTLPQLLTALDNALMSAKDPLNRRMLSQEANNLRAHAQRAEQKRSLQRRLDSIEGNSHQAVAQRDSLERELRTYDDVDLSASLSHATQILDDYADSPSEDQKQ